ncbi:hypothetical protein BH23PAT1_BH23PAT1_3350 [soil metagenome]
MRESKLIVQIADYPKSGALIPSKQVKCTWFRVLKWVLMLSLALNSFDVINKCFSLVRLS